MLIDKIIDALRREPTGFADESRPSLAREIEQIAIQHHLGEIVSKNQRIDELTEERDRAIAERDDNGRSMDRLNNIIRNREHAISGLVAQRNELAAPCPMLLTCPSCGERHIDAGEFATKPHHTHACQHCGMCWRPAIVATVGVQFLPGFKDEVET